jgi:hypothetical protein
MRELGIEPQRISTVLPREDTVRIQIRAPKPARTAAVEAA